jgi:23S rRNA pseudouridine2604 synthase
VPAIPEKGLSVSLIDTVRLNKFISDSGHCSRREADRLIESNRVRINGKKPGLGAQVGDDDEVTVDGMQIYSSAANKSDRVYIAYNKPVGITCTTEQNVKGNIIDAVDHDQRIFPIGRLDKPSDGLILLTSDGDIVNKILRAENAHDKEYLVTVNKNLDSSFASKMSSGIPILDTVTKPCKVNVIGRTAFKIVLTQGLNRQIRRMCEYLGYDVVSLTRSRIMHIELGRLRPGQWRNLTREEMLQLNSAVEQSSGQAQQKPRRSGGRPGSKPHRKPAGDGASGQKRRFSSKSGAGESGDRKEQGRKQRSKDGGNQGGRGKTKVKGKSGAAKSSRSDHGSKPATKPANARKASGKGAGKKAAKPSTNKPQQRSSRPKRK